MKGLSATATASVQLARQRLTKMLKEMKTAPKQVLSREAKKIYAQEIAMVPGRTGKLEKSIYCRVSNDKRRPGIVTGASAINRASGYNYAGIQHENTSFEHSKGEAFYISKPFNEGVVRIKAELLSRVRY